MDTFDFGYLGFWSDFELFGMELRVGRGPIGFIMVLGSILTDSQPGKSIFDPFPSRFQDFAGPGSTVFIGFATGSAKFGQVRFSRPDRKVAH